MALPATEAMYYKQLDDDRVRCLLCPFQCFIAAGQRGNCNVRENRGGVLYALTYAEVTSRALDPIEKKPLYHFFPARPILSIGEWGCNFKCQFCQNCAISQFEVPARRLSPREVARMCRLDDSIGIAYTYNEPLTAFEYVLECAQAVREAGGKNVLVTNGYVNPEPLGRLLPFVDAMNIDVKAFNEDFYHRLCKGSLAPVLETAKTAAKKTHVELTTLLIPNANDAIPELEDLARWIRDECGPQTPAHLTAYFPSYRLREKATTAAHLVHARDIFMDHLDYVYTGNIAVPGASDTVCVKCGATVIKRKAFQSDLSGMKADGTCAACGTANNIITT